MPDDPHFGKRVTVKSCCWPCRCVFLVGVAVVRQSQVDGAQSPVRCKRRQVRSLGHRNGWDMARMQRARCSVMQTHNATHTPLLAAVKSVVLVLLCAPLACPLSPPDVSKYSIVIANPTAEETYAAEQLQHWLERACGCTVPITDARAEVSTASPQLAVGYAAALALVTAAGGPSLNTSGLGQEGFVVWGDDSSFSLAVTGGESAPRCVSPCAPTDCLPPSLPTSCLATCHILGTSQPACMHACLPVCM
jgi:hypothetical protein